MAEPTTYPLRFVRDLCDIPIEKLDDCLTDLRRVILSVHTTRAMLGDLKDVVRLPETIDWADDGDRTGGVNLMAPDGSSLLGVCVAASPPPSPDTEGGRT